MKSLKLLPFDCDNATLSFSHTVLWAGRFTEGVFQFIESLPQLPVPEGFTSYVGRQEHDRTTENPYGEKVTYTNAEELCKIPSEVRESFGHTDRAVWAYLSELKPLTKVAIFWH